jgi:hypothetical protein
MSDEEKKSDLTERQRKFGGWTDEAWERYVAERNGIASKSIFDRISNINPRTGKPRRTESLKARLMVGIRRIFGGEIAANVESLCEFGINP